MDNYKALAAQFISENNIEDSEAIIGVVIYSYLKIVENKIMEKYHSEANKYCYQLTDGTIGTLPRCSVDRLSEEVLELV